MNSNSIVKVIDKHGPSAIAKACNVSPPAARRWKQNGKLPRTEHTGETNYADLISNFDPEFTREDLLKIPTKKASK